MEYFFTIFTYHQFDVISTAEYPLMQNGGTQKLKYDYISMFTNTDNIKDMESLFRPVREWRILNSLALTL
jgi:hypothetical protein